MKNALKYISIQHELGMSIGLELKLEPMLKVFSQVCIRRLNLSSMQFYITQETNSDPSHQQEQRQIKVEHFLSVPKGGGAPLEDKIPKTTRAATELYFSNQHCYDGVSTFSYIISLHKVGFVVINRALQPIAKSVLHLLKPVLARLATSCQAAIEHELLLQTIDDNRTAKELILYQLRHDELTQLPNRRMLMEALKHTLNAHNQSNPLSALCFVDLNRFKSINDSFGHAIGDHLLIAVADILQTIVLDNGTIARLSGDEFVILLSHIGQDTETVKCKVNNILTRVQQSFKRPICAGGMMLHITPSIGVRIFSAKDTSPEQILRHADIAMYQAKQDGYNSVSYYDQAQSSALEDRISIEKHLKFAVKNTDQFSLKYQPQVDAVGNIIGAEGLLRWQANQGQHLSPVKFIPVAEETGMILELGRFVLESAMENISELTKTCLPKKFKRIAVNVSGLQFNQRDFIPDFIAMLNNSGIPPERLAVELTESILIANVEEVVTKINKLRDIGIHASIDDFGTGYSSLSYLSRLPIQALKIDRSFVKNIHKEHANRAVVEAIFALGSSLNLKLVSEGVENKQELDSLIHLGCDYYQGFYFSEAMPFEQLKHSLAEAQ